MHRLLPHEIKQMSDVLDEERKARAREERQSKRGARKK